MFHSFIHPFIHEASWAVGVVGGQQRTKVEGRCKHAVNESNSRDETLAHVLFGFLEHWEHFGAFGAIGAHIAEHQGAAMVGFEMNDRRSKCKPSHNRLHYNLSLSLLH